MPRTKFGISHIQSYSRLSENDASIQLQRMDTKILTGCLQLWHADNFMLLHLPFGRNYGNRLQKKKFVCFFAIFSTFCHFLKFLALSLRHVPIYKDFR